MEKTEYKCKDCIWFEYSGKYTFCVNKDLYTDAGEEDTVCGDFININDY